MKLQKEKYLFIAILSFFIVSCGSSGGGDSSNTGASSQGTLNPPTNNNTPVKPDNGSTDVESSQPDSGNGENEDTNNKPKPDDENIKPDDGNTDTENSQPDSGNGENEDTNNKPKPDSEEIFLENLSINSSNKQGLTTKDTNIVNKGNIYTNQPIDTDFSAVPILAKDGLTATNAREGVIIGENISNKYILYGMKGIKGGNLKNVGKIDLVGHNLTGMSIETNKKNEKVLATNYGGIDLMIDTNPDGAENFGINLVGMEASH